ncbi:MAG: hypothetical protein NTX15_06550 [Candidatus Kapabacteria bacterium]|nr:hypothetical protein [Candidatus Kapabacteria bacterium]
MMTESERFWQTAKLGHLASSHAFIAAVPFVDFIFVAGSIATGNVKPESDIDLIVGCRAGRIWTVRLMMIIFLEIQGVRRRDGDVKQNSSNKICLNHFVTPASYRLQPPYNSYWVNLYQKLIPFGGNNDAIRAFFTANADWAGPRASIREVSSLDNTAREFFELILSGSFSFTRIRRESTYT